MDSLTYIKQATRTESVPKKLEVNQMAFDSLLGSLVAMGKVADLFKRRLYYGQEFDALAMRRAIEDVTSHSQNLGSILDVYGAAINNRLPVPKALNMQGDMDRVDIRLLHCALGCFTESVEMVECLQKQYETGVLDKVNFGEEVGDVEWYQAIGFDASGVSEASCREANIAKLRKRYPDAFTALDATERNLEQEREALEVLGPRGVELVDTNG